MKIDKVKIGATIPTQAYGNIMPEIEISSDDGGEDLINAGMVVIKDLYKKYSEKGELLERIPLSVALEKKSFNEDVVIEFEPESHTYRHNGKILKGVTDYVKTFYKPFDADTISSILESQWGVPQSIIKKYWEVNGDLTSLFGDVVHKTLEHFEKFKDFGEIISSKKGDEKNYCLPKHPILRHIVEEFLKLPMKQGTVFTEVLVSSMELGMCGQADRILVIDKDKKICRVQDYKVNIESEKIDKSLKAKEPFNSLPANKLTKYQIQMSIYANFLQRSGWSVEGLDVFVYEDNWKHFELPVLQVFN